MYAKYFTFEVIDTKAQMCEIILTCIQICLFGHEFKYWDSYRKWLNEYTSMSCCLFQPCPSTVETLELSGSLITLRPKGSSSTQSEISDTREGTLSQVKTASELGLCSKCHFQKSICDPDCYVLSTVICSIHRCNIFLFSFLYLYFGPKFELKIRSVCH